MAAPRDARRAREDHAVEQIATEVARRIPAVAARSDVSPLQDPEGLKALLETWPNETLPAALGTVVALAEVAERTSRSRLSKALMDVASAVVPRLQALLAVGAVSLERASPEAASISFSGPGFLA